MNPFSILQYRGFGSLEISAIARKVSNKTKKGIYFNMNDIFRADLHCHTTCSDGTVNPSDMIELASHLDLKGLSITDHDTIEAYPQAMPLAKNKNLPLISGVEFSAVHRETSIHILGYGFDLHAFSIKKFCHRHYERRNDRNQSILKLLATHGMPLSEEDFPPELFTSESKQSIGRPHIALAMIKKGYVNSVQQAFQAYLGDGRPCYAPGNAFSIEETLEIIHDAKGLAMIAHPHLIENVGILKELLTMKFDGIEGYYARFPRKDHERWIKIGARKGWIITGGSDFHGAIKPNLPLGSSWVNEETFSILLKHFHSNQPPQ